MSRLGPVELDRAAGALVGLAAGDALGAGDDAAIAETAMAVSLLTHGDPLAAEAFVLWCIGIDRAVRQGRLDGVADGLELLAPASRDRWARHLEEAKTRPPAAFSPNGFVVTALQAAYAAVRQTEVPEGPMACTHLQRALERAVQIGNDTDTVAAIAGQLLGARWGASAVPLRWQSVLHGWPGYRVADLTRLAVATARQGQPDADGWPTGDTMLDVYRERFGATGKMVALADDPGVHLGDAGAGAGATADEVVVSLCRMGRTDIPAGVEHHGVWLVDDADPARKSQPGLCAGRAGPGHLRVAGTATRRPRPLRAGREPHPHGRCWYLSTRFDLQAGEALERVRAVLPGARPNASFVAALHGLWPGR